MSNYSLKEVYTSVDHYKLFSLRCPADELDQCIASIKSENIRVVNIGKELAAYIDTIEDYKYLSMDIYDFTKKLLEINKSKIAGQGNDVLAIYNVGILLEPRLELNAVQLLKEFSKSAALIIIWENESERPGLFNWPTQKQNYYLDFSDKILKELHNAI